MACVILVATGQAVNQESRPDQQFEAVVREFGPLLRNCIQFACPGYLTGSRDDIEQHALLKIWRAVECGREIANYPSYIRRIAVTTTIDAIRSVKARREEQLELAEDPPEDGGARHRALASDSVLSPEAAAQAGELGAIVQQCLQRLSPDRAKAVGLHIQGYTTEETGKMLGWSEAKARNLTYPGLKDLRRLLKERGIEHESD